MRELRIGSAPDNDLVFDQPMVSGYHAKLVAENGAYYVVDLDSTNGTFVEGLQVSREEVRVGAHIGLGSLTFVLGTELVERLAPRASASKLMQTTEEPRRAASVTLAEAQSVARLAQASTTQPEGLHSITLGYHESNTLAINAAQVSGYHARLTEQGGVYYIADLQSTNGTFVNEVRVDEPAQVLLGDTIGLGSYRFTFDEGIVKHFGSRVGASTLAIDLSGLDWKRSPSTGTLTVGRADDNDVAIPAPQVSGFHAELRPVANGWMLKDVGSLNGTYVNARTSPLVPHTEVLVTERDIVFLGSYRFPMSRIAQHDGPRARDERVRLPADQDVLTIGRGPENDIVLDSPSVSRAHARLQRQGESWVLEDLGSANGTYVDGERIARREVKPENLVAFGTYIVRLDPDKGLLVKEYQGEIMLRAEAISVDVRDRGAATGSKRLLNEISFTAYPTEFIGIMGPSGAGKTTLMMALNGYMPPTKGQSLINNLDLYRNYNQFRGNIGYVPQDDIIHRELTVFESLLYTAKLRLPPDTSHAEIERLIDRTLQSLGILDTKHVLIGSPLNKGISGGQRKRVNLAQELITQPSLLFLDEPTSGLASTDALSVMKLLRRLADEGRTILMTLHQPSLAAYREMDNVLYLAKGRLVYFGPTYPDSIAFFNPEATGGTPAGDRILSNPDSAMGPVAEDNASPEAQARIADREAAYKSSKYYADYVAGRREGQTQVQLTASRKERKPRRFGLRQWWVLTRRMFTIKLKDVANTAILLLQAPIIGLLIAIVFGLKNQAVGGPIEQFLTNQGSEGIDAAALFMLVASAVWFGTSNSAREIVAEQAIYRRERMVNLRIVSYVLSKFAVLSVLSLVQCAMLLGIVHPLLGLHGDFVHMLLLLFSCSTAGLGIGLTLSAIVRSTEAAVALVPLLLIPQLVLGGLIVPMSNLDGGVRTAVRYSAGAMVARWAFEGLLHVEEAARPEPPAIAVAEEDQALAERFELTPQKPQRVRSFGGIRFEDRDRVRQLEAVFRTRLARLLEANQRDAGLVERYFGGFSVGPGRSLLVLLAFNVVLLALVCVILRAKDTEVT